MQLCNILSWYLKVTGVPADAEISESDRHYSAEENETKQNKHFFISYS